MKYSAVLLFLIAVLYGCSGSGGCNNFNLSPVITPSFENGLNLSASPAAAKPGEAIQMRAFLVINGQVAHGWFSNSNNTSKWTTRVVSGTSTVSLTPDPTEQSDGSVTARVESTAPCTVRVTFTTGSYEKSMDVTWTQ